MRRPEPARGGIDVSPITHKPVLAEHLPKPMGPYSPGMGFERLVFVSGQGGIDPSSGRLAGNDVAAQTEQCLRNIEAILRSAGSGLQHVLRCGVFLIDMREFQQMNAVYQRVFGDHRPARTTIQASALPGTGLRVEIDAIAYVPEPAGEGPGRGSVDPESVRGSTGR